MRIRILKGRRSREPVRYLYLVQQLLPDLQEVNEQNRSVLPDNSRSAHSRRAAHLMVAVQVLKATLVDLVLAVDEIGAARTSHLSGK